MAIKHLCAGTNTSMGGVQGGMRRERKSPCPVCGRMVGMRAGRAGRLYPHSYDGKGHPIRLIRDTMSCVYTEENRDVTWVSDEYTEPRESLFDCVVCGDEIEEWVLFTCLDGGDAAHVRCVKVVG